MRFKDLSLKHRLIYAFIAIAMVASSLSALVFLYFLVENLKKSTKDQISETLKTVFSRTDEVTRNLETYADLISSDIHFGQLLSFDSSSGIQNKINDLQSQSHADYTIFVPKPIQYIQIKNEIFSSSAEKNSLKQAVKGWVEGNRLLEQETSALKGWIEFENTPMLFVAKPVLYFGTNMGVIVLLKEITQEFSKKLYESVGAHILFLSSQDQVISSSLAYTVDHSNPFFRSLSNHNNSVELVENVTLGRETFLSLVSPLSDYSKKTIGKAVLLISNASVQEAKRKTILSAVIVALVTIFLSVGIGFMLANAISRPILSMTRSMQKIAESEDLSIRVQSDSGAEMGILSTSFNKLLEQLQSATDKLAASERRMKQELTMASTVQEMLFPEPLVQYGRLTLASHIQTSSETGGDWFGFSEEKQSKVVSILIGDVTGHGMPAALITAITNGFFKGVFEGQLGREDSLHFKNLLNTDALLKKLNQILIEATDKQLLMTFFAAVFDQSTLELHYSNAGHLRPFLCKKTDAGFQLSTLPSQPGKRLGEDAEVQFPRESIRLERGDLMVFYTDGILDCANPHDEPYGKRRFMNSIKKHSTKDPQAMLEHIIGDFEAFLEGAPKIDDITLVLAQVT